MTDYHVEASISDGLLGCSIISVPVITPVTILSVAALDYFRIVTTRLSGLVR